MGLYSNLKEKIRNELDKVKAAEQSQYPEEVDERTKEELSEIDDNTANIEATRCNWGKDTKTNRRTANLTRAYAAETPIGKGIATKSREQNRSREDR